jgi:hypothetical protein
MTNLQRDLIDRLSDLQFKIRSLRMDYNLSLDRQLSKAIDELAEQFLMLSHMTGFTGPEAAEAIGHLYNLPLRQVFEPLENILLHGTPTY